MSEQDLMKGQVAIVTGAARGIGAAVSGALLDAGASVYMTDVLEEELAQTVAGLGERAHASTLDVSDEAGWSALVEQVLADNGRVDLHTMPSLVVQREV